MNKKTLYKTGSVILALIVWQTVAMLVQNDILLVSPVKVIERLATVWRDSGFVETVIFSMVRILLGFLSAFILGTVFGFIAGRFSAVEYILWPYVVAVKSVPVASFIILLLMWLSNSQFTVLIGFLIAFPVMYSNVLTGIKSTDGKMLEMASIYKLSWTKKLFYIYLPNVKPYLISASRVTIGMTWKAGIAAEVIGVVNGSIGEKLYTAKIYLQMVDLFAWTIIIIILSFLIEKLFVFILKRIFGGLEKI